MPKNTTHVEQAEVPRQQTGRPFCKRQPVSQIFLEGEVILFAEKSLLHYAHFHTHYYQLDTL